MGIRGDSVLVPWRPFFWIAAEVVQLVRLNGLRGRKKTDRHSLYRRAAAPELLGGRLGPKGPPRTAVENYLEQKGGRETACCLSAALLIDSTGAEPPVERWEWIERALSVSWLCWR